MQNRENKIETNLWLPIKKNLWLPIKKSIGNETSFIQQELIRFEKLGNYVNFEYVIIEYSFVDR